MLLNIKRTFLPDLIWVLLPVWICLLLCYGCNTRIEGCLDVQAENFDLNAEKNCTGCCTYPSIGLALSQKWNDRNFSNADTLLDINLKPYKIQDLKYFFSSWRWMDVEGQTYTIDTTYANCDGNLLGYTQDILFIDSRQFVYTLGTIQVSPQLDSIHFFMGLVEDFICLDDEDPKTPTILTEQSPLWNNDSALLSTIRLVLQKDISMEIFDTLFIETLMPLHFDYDFQIPKGIDYNFTLTVDYAKWFEDADIENLSTFQNSILTHFNSSISKTP